MTEPIVCVHQVRLADLKGIAELWEVPDDNLGLKIKANGNLVPICIDKEGDGETASLKDMLIAARKKDPNSSELDLGLDLIILVYHPKSEEESPRLRIATLEETLELQESWTRWWTFSDDYKGKMN